MTVFLGDEGGRGVRAAALAGGAREGGGHPAVCLAEPGGAAADLWREVSEHYGYVLRWRGEGGAALTGLKLATLELAASELAAREAAARVVSAD